MSATVGVVVPHYDDAKRLRWVLNALARQSFPAERMHVVVADDGSPHPPALPELPFRCELVRQADQGFRAAAARNLGAATVEGDLLVFLDGDTVPAPGYVSALSQAAQSSPHGFLGVGRREHADFIGCSDEQVEAWVRSGPPAEQVLPSPRWLRDGYARTGDLRDAGEEDFRLVISAVLAVDRDLFERAGGFDATITGYGGEDWDLAWRCWLLGSRMRHVPDAVAWHDGPDAGARAGARSAGRAAKDGESLALAERITLPSVRGRGLVWARPDIAVRIHGRHSDAALYLTAVTLLRDSDAGIWLVDHEAVPHALTADPRVHAGPLPPVIRDRARFHVELWTPLLLQCTLTAACAADEVHVPGVLRIRRTRQLALGAPDPASVSRPPWVCAVPDEGLEQVLGRWNSDE
ncbi:glycosyltransferase [Allobranchiibius sp. CTAmp26]|uniref:glycosyltransferase n=1 Tax=Allobranchiibius sp. CTAmp26 TaxID=2815214 RepID=UPI001AA1D107|nr:glycosyltransferase [Allobranchiibius sp. CTAmp26]MBO1754990.1 glycosyltransferase family 2 protein [Allobranchiibius sp. CTAmp26]